jgi:hypothetical protein
MNKLNCALNWEASVRRGVHMNRGEAGVMVGRFGEIVVHEAELFEFTNNIEAGGWCVRVAGKRSISVLV